MSTNKLSGKIALVTGGSSGIELATAKRFVSEGAYVFITGRRQPELDAAVKLIGSDVTGICSDVSSLADLDRVYAAIKSEKGRLDISLPTSEAVAWRPLARSPRSISTKPSIPMFAVCFSPFKRRCP